MKKIKNNFTEKLIINKYFKTLSLNKKGTFNFENDAAYLNIPHKNYKFAVTTDTILENIDLGENIVLTTIESLLLKNTQRHPN